MNQLIKIGIIIIIGWGLFFNMAFIFSFDKKYPEKCDLTAIAKVVSMKKEKQNSNCYTVKITKADRKSLKNTKIILYTTKEKDAKPGEEEEIPEEETLTITCKDAAVYLFAATLPADVQKAK